MIKELVGGEAVEKVLLYIANYGEGYAAGIADCFDLRLYAVQKALLKLENAGIVVSQNKGRTRVFMWNPRYPLKNELLGLLEAALQKLPKTETQKYFRKRMRPRKTTKPL